MKVFIMFALLAVGQISQGLSKNTKSSPSSTFCKGRAAGLYKDPNSCDKFFQCDQSGRSYAMQCPKGTWFDVTIGVCNHINQVTCRQIQTVPSKPRSLKIVAINSTTIQVRWKKPGIYSKPLRNYQIIITRSGSSQSLKYTAAPSLLSIMIMGLLPGSRYNVTMNAVNSVGIGKPAIGAVTTPFNIPPPPFIISAKAMDSKTISLKWKDPILDNDAILNYIITYRKANKQDRFSLRLKGYAQTAMIKHLQPGTAYEVRVQAVTFGAYGKPAIVKVRTSTGDLCPQGYHSKTGKKPCLPCMYGSYQQAIGKKSCIKCLPGTTTLIKGAKSKSQCINVTID